MMYMWALEKHFSAYEHCALGEAVDDWTNFVMGKLSQYTMRDALNNARKMTRAATVASIDRQRAGSGLSTLSGRSASSTSRSETSSSISSGGKPTGAILLRVFSDGAVHLTWGLEPEQEQIIHSSFRWIFPNIADALRRIQRQCDASDLIELGQYPCSVFLTRDITPL
jgi:hypothetical protein